MSMTYLTTEELPERIKFNLRTIRNEPKNSVLLEGQHNMRPFGHLKVLFLWENIEVDKYEPSNTSGFAIPMVKEGVCYGMH